MPIAVNFTNDALQAKLEQSVLQTGRPAEELVEDAESIYFDELQRFRSALDGRYDDTAAPDLSSTAIKILAGVR